MDTHTLDKLEFPQVRRLVGLFARSSLGRELAGRLAPWSNAGVVRQRLDELRQFVRYSDAEGMPPFGGLSDVRPLVQRAVPPATLDAEEVSAVAASLRCVNQLREWFERLNEQHAALAPLAARLGDFTVVAGRIDAVIDDRSRVRDDATPRLGRLRSRIGELKQDVRTLFDRLLRHATITRLLAYPNATFHADRMVLPLKSDYRGRIPGVVHRSSDTGQTLFVEPEEAVQLNNAIIELTLEENNEVGRVLWELTHLIHLNQAEILRTFDAVAIIDLLAAKTAFAKHYGLSVPAVDDGHRVYLRNARHPLLLARGPVDVSGRPAPAAVVPIDLRLGDDFDLLIITGPNTGGKTVATKTIGLLALMAQAALPIPADPGAVLPVFDQVLVDIGDEQSLQQSLSTFSAHLARILDVLNRSTRRSLALLDEMGAGTDPDDGAAIGRAMIDRLLEIGCLGVVTTHLGALKSVAYEHPRIENASVEFDYETLRPTYRLRIGEPGNSNAIIMAARLGMPTELVSRAQRYLAERDLALSRAIAGTIETRRAAEESRRAADIARDRAEKERGAAEKTRHELQTERERFARWVKRVTSLQRGERVRVRRFDKEGSVVQVQLHKQIVVVAVGAIEVEVPFTDVLLPDG